VSENRILRRIFGLKRDEVTGEWSKLHSEELHNLYSSPNIIRQIKSRWMRWVGHMAHMGEDRKVYKVLVAKPKGKSALRRTSCRWKDGIRMYLSREIVWGCVELIQVALSNMMVNVWVLVPWSYSVTSFFPSKT
jgi:hypothetical protein